MKRVVPFGNATEAMMWLSANCENCMRLRCRGRIEIEMGFVLGDIDRRVAEMIGIREEKGEYVKLKLECMKKESYLKRIRKQKKDEYPKLDI